MMRRTAAVNQIRGLPLERDITLRSHLHLLKLAVGLSVASPPAARSIESPSPRPQRRAASGREIFCPRTELISWGWQSEINPPRQASLEAGPLSPCSAPVKCIGEPVGGIIHRDQSIYQQLHLTAT